MKEKLEYVWPFLIYGGMILVIWLGGTFFAKTVSDSKVINPAPGVSCVVVSRMFNTSVDCWKE